MRAILAVMLIGIGCATAFGQVLVSDDFNDNDLNKGVAWKVIKPGVTCQPSSGDANNIELFSSDKGGAIKTDLTGTLGDTVSIQFGAKTSGTEQNGPKTVQVYLVNEKGEGPGLSISLSRKDTDTKVTVVNTADNGGKADELKEATVSGDPENKLHKAKLVINRTSGQCEAFYDGKSVTTWTLSNNEQKAALKDLKAVVVVLASAEMAVIDDVAVFNGSEMPTNSPATAPAAAPAAAKTDAPK